MNLKKPQLHALRDCLNRSEGDVDKALEQFQNYVHKDYAEINWRDHAEKIKADPQYVENYK